MTKCKVLKTTLLATLVMQITPAFAGDATAPAATSAAPAATAPTARTPAATAPAATTPAAMAANATTQAGPHVNPIYSIPCNCAASGIPTAPPAKKKGGHKILKGLAHEMGMEMGDLGKDTFMLMSVGGKDPYEMPAHPDIPYVAAEAQFVDGESSHLVKYPDGSYRMQGGFLNGTYACPQADGIFIVCYPNGARGTLRQTGDGAVIERPDNTVTTITQKGESYRISNSKLGYMGDITPDTTGLSYEFAKQDF